MSPRPPTLNDCEVIPAETHLEPRVVAWRDSPLAEQLDETSCIVGNRHAITVAGRIYFRRACSRLIAACLFVQTLERHVSTVRPMQSFRTQDRPQPDESTPGQRAARTRRATATCRRRRHPRANRPSDDLVCSRRVGKPQLDREGAAWCLRGRPRFHDAHAVQPEAE